MRAAEMKQRPHFSLMKQTDIQSIIFLQMPCWLYSDNRYADMSLDAKVTYTFLLNRFQLSRRSGWINEREEVFIIFPRQALAKELRICERRIIAAIRMLAERNLIWEKRCGRGAPNQIYLAKITPQDDPTYECTPFLAPDEIVKSSASIQELPDQQFLNCGIGNSRTAESAVAELPNPQSSYNDKNNTEESYTDVSQSVYQEGMHEDRLTHDEDELQDILDNCDLDCLSSESAMVFENAIERLFFSDSFRLGNATLPRSRLRAKLRKVDLTVLQATERKLSANVDKSIRNSTNYVMATLLNCITEVESDLMVDAYLNNLQISHKTGGEYYASDP